MTADEISSLLDSLGFYRRSKKGEEVPEEFQQFPLRAPRDELKPDTRKEQDRNGADWATMPVFYTPIPQNLRLGLAYASGSVFGNNRTGDALEQNENTGNPCSQKTDILPGFVTPSREPLMTLSWGVS
ncbi:hypothetical protein JZ751_023486 [Albula glossodonta]|uniref:Uncharacterized protein n=1 Tax=Albula glossodonta TaxID=121402 RepID=A0A8T2NGS5_9TELE|nr:hypothetical protein JZ751_023486 [Albula glossodonta]